MGALRVSEVVQVAAHCFDPLSLRYALVSIGVRLLLIVLVAILFV
jgi:hypothetical protein